MSLSTDLISFNSVQAGDSETILMNVTNVGQAELIITDFDWSLPVFDVIFSNLNVSAGVSVDISISFSPTANQTYTDSLEIRSNAGFGYVILEGRGVVAIEDEYSSLPAEYMLEQNYPNPFNPTTRIRYTLPQSGDVSLIVYDLLGQEVALLINDNMHAGNHQVRWDASNLSSGIYFYRLQADDFVQTRKMVYLK